MDFVGVARQKQRYRVGVAYMRPMFRLLAKVGDGMMKMPSVKMELGAV